MNERQGHEVNLVNCTQDPLHVAVGGEVYALPTAAMPNAMSAMRSSTPLIVNTPLGTTGVALETGSGGSVTLNAPPRAEGTLYVVSPDSLAQFPYRADFVAVASYRYGSLQRDGEGEAEQVVIVTGLTTNLPVADPASVNFTGVTPGKGLGGA